MPDVIPPTTPTDLTAITQYLVSPQVNLSWTASTDSGGSGLAGYQVEVDQGSGFTFIGGTDAVTTTFAASGLLQGKVSSFRVRAFDAEIPPNYSGWSASAVATTLQVIDGYDSPEATDELLPDSAGLGGFFSVEAQEIITPYSTSCNPCPPATEYRMRAYDTTLMQTVYWNSPTLVGSQAYYTGPGPLTSLVTLGFA